MKTKKIALILAACIAAVLALASCAQPQASEPSSSSAAQSSSSSSSTSSSASTSATTASLPTNPFYVLIVGNDSRTGTPGISEAQYADGKGRSDVMMLCRVDPTTYTITLVSVPRDTPTIIDGSKFKLNDVYCQKGIDALEREIEGIAGVDISYSLDMGFVNFAKFIDDMGGITANVPIDMSLTDVLTGNKISLSAGVQDLNGNEALVLARTRKAYEVNNMDAVRQIADRQLVIDGIQKVLDNPENEAIYLAALTANGKTDMSSDELKLLVDDFIANKTKVTFYSGTGPYDGGIDEETQLWLVYPNEAMWQQVMSTVDAGGNPDEVLTVAEAA